MYKKILISALLIFINTQMGATGKPEQYLKNRLTKNDGRYDTFHELLRLLDERGIQEIVETGTARCGDTNFDGDGGSTIIFGHWCTNNNARMVSVDISQKFIEVARNAAKPYMNHITFVQDDSVNFLDCYKGKIGFLYLDSFDYDDKDPLPAQIHCLREIMAAHDKLDKHAIIMIDDCNLKETSNGNVKGIGKGPLAVEYLLKHGWYIHMNRHQVILLRKN